jgi:hypothetical protein
MTQVGVPVFAQFQLVVPVLRTRRHNVSFEVPTANFWSQAFETARSWGVMPEWRTDSTR